MYNFCAFNNDKKILEVATSAPDEATTDKDASNNNSCSTTPSNFGERPSSFLVDENDDYALVTKGNFCSDKNKNDKDLVVVRRYETNTDDCIIEIKNYYRNMAQRLRVKQQRSSLLDSEKGVEISSRDEIEIPPLTLPVSPEEIIVSKNVESQDCSSTLESSTTTKQDLNSTNSTVNDKLSLNDGRLDYSTLKKLLRKQRRLYKKKLEEEKTKREALEEFLIKFNNNNSIDSRRSSSLNGFHLTSSTDSLLAKLLDEQQKSENFNHHHRRKLWDVEKSFSSNNLNLEEPTKLTLKKNFARRRDRQRKFSDDSTTTTSGGGTQITQLTSNSDGIVAEQKWKFCSNSSRPINGRFLPKMVGNSTKPFVSYFLPLEMENAENKSIMEAKKKLLIEKSKRRREKITDASRERQKLAELSRDLAANVLIGRLSLKDAAKRFDALPEPPAAISRQQLFRASKKKFQMLPEIREKREKLLQEFEICTNRIRVKMYSQKQLNRTLSKPQSSRV